jgi:hypothetical protein
VPYGESLFIWKTIVLIPRAWPRLAESIAEALQGEGKRWKSEGLSSHPNDFRF